MIDKIVCFVKGHEWQSGKMYSDGWTNTCQRCGEEEVHDR